MTDEAQWHDGPEWLVQGGAAEGWGEREWIGWEIIRKRFDELGPFELEKTDPDAQGIGAYGEPGTFFETVNYDERFPLYGTVHRLLKQIAQARRESDSLR